MFWFFEKVIDIFNNIVIFGDLNIDFLKVNNLYEIYIIMNNYRLINIIYEFIRSIYNINIFIDFIINSEKICVYDFGIISVCNVFSDYWVIYIYIY